MDDGLLQRFQDQLRGRAALEKINCLRDTGSRALDRIPDQFGRSGWLRAARVIHGGIQVLRLGLVDAVRQTTLQKDGHRGMHPGLHDGRGTAFVVLAIVAHVQLVIPAFQLFGSLTSQGTGVG